MLGMGWATRESDTSLLRVRNRRRFYNSWVQNTQIASSRFDFDLVSIWADLISIKPRWMDPQLYTSSLFFGNGCSSDQDPRTDLNFTV